MSPFVAYKKDETSKEDIHCIPEFEDEPKHVIDGPCWCEPNLEDYTKDGGSKLYIHRRTT